jgi:hypothetical protein
MLQVWSDCEQAIYAGADDRASHTEQTWQQAEENLRWLESRHR